MYIKYEFGIFPVFIFCRQVLGAICIHVGITGIVMCADHFIRKSINSGFSLYLSFVDRCWKCYQLYIRWRNMNYQKLFTETLLLFLNLIAKLSVFKFDL